jgi:hypothetical protein
VRPPHPRAAASACRQTFPWWLRDGNRGPRAGTPARTPGRPCNALPQPGGAERARDPAVRGPGRAPRAFPRGRERRRHDGPRRTAAARRRPRPAAPRLPRHADAEQGPARAARCDPTVAAGHRSPSTSTAMRFPTTATSRTSRVLPAAAPGSGVRYHGPYGLANCPTCCSGIDVLAAPGHVARSVRPDRAGSAGRSPPRAGQPRSAACRIRCRTANRATCCRPGTCTAWAAIRRLGRQPRGGREAVAFRPDPGPRIRGHGRRTGSHLRRNGARPPQLLDPDGVRPLRFLALSSARSARLVPDSMWVVRTQDYR